jgi:hypothetical protein
MLEKKSIIGEVLPDYEVFFGLFVLVVLSGELLNYFTFHKELNSPMLVLAGGVSLALVPLREELREIILGKKPPSQS